MSELLLSNVETLSPNKFNYKNSFNYNQVPTPVHLDLHDKRNGFTLLVAKGWTVTGVCYSPPQEIMSASREGQIVIMLFHPDEGELWQHYPLYKKSYQKRTVRFKNEN